jgi:hypothetical protein
LKNPQFGLRLSYIPAFCIILLGGFLSLWLHSLFDSYSSLVISRKPRDMEFAAKAMQLLEESASGSVRRSLEESLVDLTKGIHRNTAFLMFEIDGQKPKLTVQPENSLNSEAISKAIKVWNDHPYGDDLYRDGVVFDLAGDTYHVIARRQTVFEGSYELVLVTNVDRAVAAEYNKSATNLALADSVIAAFIVLSVLSLTLSVGDAEKSLRRDGIKPKWFWTINVISLWEQINSYKAEMGLYRIQIDQSTSGQMIVRSKGMAEAIIYNPNLALAKISGHAQSELEGRPLNKIVPKEYHQYHLGLGVFDEELKRRVGMMSYAEGCPFHGSQESRIVGRDRTVDLLHKDGSIRKVVLGVYYVGKNEDGTDEWVGVVTDVTELTDAIAKADSYAQEIETVSRIFAHDLKADVIASAKAGEFVSETATELIEFLGSEGTIDPDAKESLEFIEKFSKRITLACQNAFSLIDQRNKLHNLKERIEQRPQSVTSIIKSVESAFTRSDGLLITNNHCSEGTAVIVDNALFLSVLKNLIKNSFIHNKSDQKEVSFTSTEKNGKVQFVIKDNGVGFPPEYLKDWGKVQGKAARLSTETEGSGVGLYSVRKIIDAHVGASIIIKSELGVGSVFEITVGAGS